jgi:hypothetical protein
MLLRPITTTVCISLAILCTAAQAMAQPGTQIRSDTTPKYSEAAQALAQLGTQLDERLSLGIAVNYGGKYFESDGDMLNDIWSSGYGYEIRALWNFPITPEATLNTGLQLLVNRYRFDEQLTPETNEVGLPTGRIGILSMNKAVGTTYLGIPLRISFQPLSNAFFYAFAGTDLALKIASQNGSLRFRWDVPSDEDIFADNYDVPELSRNLMVFAHAGVGVSLPEQPLPINIELGVRQSVTPYMDREDFFTTWLRSFTLAITYRL